MPFESRPSFTTLPAVSGCPVAQISFATYVRRIATRLGQLCLAVWVVLVCSAGFAQTARVAGAVSGFGSSLTSAVGVAADDAQNAYVLSSTGNVYKETWNSGTQSYSEALLFTTASGSGSGIAVDASGANVYVGTGSGKSVVRYTGSGTSYSVAGTVATLSGATAPAVDAGGNVYIADAAAGNVYMEAPGGGAYAQSTLASGLANPVTLTIDAAKNLFVNNGAGSVVELVNGGNGYTKSTVVAGLTGIASLAVDKADNIFALTANGLVESVLSGGAYSTTPYYQYTGQGVDLDSLGNVYLVAATQNSGVKLTTSGGYVNFGSAGPNSPATATIAFTATSAGTLGTPLVVTQGLAGKDFTPVAGGSCAGTHVVSGTSCTVMVQFQPLASGSRLGAVNLTDSAGTVIASSYLGGVGLAPLAVYQSVTLLQSISSSLSQGRGLTVDPGGNVFLANSTANQIVEFPFNAASNTYAATPTVLVSNTGTCLPVGTAIDGVGNLYYTCNTSQNVYELVGGTGTPVAIPVGYYTDDHLSVDAAGNLYPTSYGNAAGNAGANLFLKVAAGTHAVSVIAAAPARARFVGAVTDAAGNTFAPDYNNSILYELKAGSNTLTTLYSGAPLQFPHAIAEDAAGNLYVTNTTGQVGAGTSNVLRFAASNYSATPAAIAVPGADSIAISPDGDFYTIYNNANLAVYTRARFTLTYASTAVGASSAPQTVTLENDGTAPLTIEPPASGLNPSISTGFTYDSASTCPLLSSGSAPATLAVGATCTDAIRFTPQMVGTVSGSLRTSDNSANTPGSVQTVLLSGSATQGTPSFSVADASGVLGQGVTITATASSGGTAPTGVVTIKVGTGPTVTAACTSASPGSETCTATYPTTQGLQAGANTIAATLAADTNYVGATATGTLTLQPATTTSTVVSSLNPSTLGAAVTFTGKVSSGYGTPTGTVTFLDGANSLGTATLDAAGRATLTSLLGVGSHGITLSYGGVSSYAVSTSAVLSQVVNQGTGANVLSSSNTTPSFGSSVTLTDSLGTLAGVVPSGTVMFYNGTVALGAPVAVSAAGTAALTTANLPVGTDTIKAVYSGDASYVSTTSNLVTETVSKATGYTNALASSNATPSFGTAITLTDTLPVLGSGAPTGTVTFLNGTVQIGQGTLDANGKVTLTTGALPVGSDSITAVYGGDGNYAGTTSNLVVETVAKASGYNDVLTSSNATPVFGSSVTLTTTMGAVNGVYPTGTVTFLNGGAAIGTGTISATGVATLATGSLPVGTGTITTSYTGDGNFVAATSNAVTETVSKADVSSDGLVTSNSAPAFGSIVTLTNTLAATNGVYPTGTVTFYANSTVLGTGTVNSSGVATLSTTALPVGSSSVQAIYGGDGNFNSATSKQVGELVGKGQVAGDVLTTSDAAPALGVSVTLTDTFVKTNGVMPTGTVTFYSGNTALGTGTIDASGVATLSTTALPVGTSTVTAVYAGDVTFITATSNGVQENVSKAVGYGNVLASSNTSPTLGTAVTFTASLAAVNGTHATGTVTFYNGTTAMGTGTLSAVGVATLTTSALPVGTASITAVYSGDNSFAGSTSNAVTETVGKADVAGNALTTSNASPAFGSSVTFTDTLTAQGGTYPAGTVTFYNGTTSIGTGTLSATGVATLTTSALPVGTSSITAVFAGDTSFNTSTSNAVTETIGKASGFSDVLTTSNASPGFGNNVTFTDTIATVNNVVPTGMVTFYRGTTAIGTGTLSASGVATLTTKSLPAGSSSITAVFAGDTTFAGATSNAVQENVAQASGYGDVLTASDTSPAFGTAVTLTDTLAAVNGVFATGTVTFYDGATVLGTGTLNASGVALLPAGALPVGTHAVKAVYAGDSTFAGASSNTVSITVGKASGYGDVLAASTTTPAFGNPVTLTNTLAAVDGVYPTGTVTFFNGTTAIGTGSVSLTGVATLVASVLPVGSDVITAVYGGDGSFSGATSNAVTVNVGKVAVSGDVLTSSNTSPSFGSSVTFTDTLGSLNGETPAGTVTFYNGTTAIGTGVLSATGVATLTTSALPPGTSTITAVFAGDGNFAGATSNAVTETVSKASGSNELTTSNVTLVFGSPVTLTDTLATLGGAAPTGTVTFYNGATVLGTGRVNGSGVATLTTAALPVGVDSVTAVYGGDGNYATSTSNAVTETVSKASVSADVLTSSTITAAYGQNVDFTDTLAATNGVYPTGTVTFYNGTTAIGTANLNANGVATFSTATLPVGADAIRVEYGGDANFNNTASNTVTVTVGRIAATSGDSVTGSGTFGAATTPITVTIPFSGPAAPTGAITVMDTHGESVSLPAAACTTQGSNMVCTGNMPTANEPAGSNTVSVSQAADANYSGSTGGGTITLSRSGQTAGDTASGAGTYGAPATAVTITIPYSGAVPPTGVITLADAQGNTVSIAAASCAAANGTLTCPASLPTANEPVGSNAVSVSQAADANYAGSTGTGTIAIAKAPATANDTATGNGSYGAATTPVLVKIPFAGQAAPSGDITLADTLGNTMTVPASSCTASGGVLTCVVSLPTANDPVGSTPLTVRQAADGNYSGSTGAGTLTMGPAGSRGDDTVSGSGTYGMAATPITAIIPYTGSTAPTGAITVADALGNSIVLAAASCSVSGGSLVCAGSLATANEPVGNNAATVSQAADASHAATSGTGVITISAAAGSGGDTATGQGTYGAPTTAVTVTIPFAGTVAPAGAITLADTLGNTITAPASQCTQAGQQLSCVVNLPTANVPVGSNAVSVAQAADANYQATSGAGSITIAAASVSPVSSPSGGVQNVTISQGTSATLLTATLVYSGATPPTGTVVFTVGTGQPVTATCVASGSQQVCTASYPTASLAVGIYTITAAEAADANYAAGSATGMLTVEATAVSAVLDSVSNVSNVVIAAGTATANLSASLTFSGPLPTGGLSFTLPGGVPVAATCTTGASPLLCTATYPTAALTAGAYVITATEAADSNYAQGAATALLTVTATPGTPVSPVLNSGSYVSSVLVPYGAATATLSGTLVFSGPLPTGVVSFTVVGGAGGKVTANCTSSASPVTCQATYPTADLGVGSYRIQMDQDADGNYPAGRAIGTLTVSNLSTGAGDSATGSGNYGDLTSQVTITIPYVGSVAPSGVVTLTDAAGNSVTLQGQACTASAAALTCTAQLPTANVPVGADALTVTQAGDANYAASSGGGTLTINKTAATTGDSALGSGTAGAATTTIAVSIPYGGAVAPSGPITVADGLGNTVTVLASTCTAAGGVLRCNVDLPTVSEPVGVNPLTVTQAADSNYNGSTGAGNLTLSKAGAGSGDTASGSGVYGTLDTAVAITIPYSGSVSPTGAVTVADSFGNTVTVAASSCTMAGGALHCMANLPTASEPVGNNPVTVSQAADAVSNGSTGSGVIAIAKAAATSGDTVSGSGSYGAAKVPVTVVIPFAGKVPPAGAITVTDAFGNTVTVPTSACTVSGATLSCSVSFSAANEPLGTNALTVTQAPDANYAGSSGSGQLVISKATPALVAPVVAPLNAPVGTSVTLTQTVPADEMGTVTFLSGSTVLGTATIANGVATLTTTALTEGVNNITAVANGDSHYGSATSPVVVDTVGAVHTATIALGSSQPTITAGSSVTFTATVGTTPATAVAGTVTFSDGTTALGTATVSGGIATLSTSTLTVGSHTLTATFTPAAGSALSAVTSTPIAQQVQPIPTTITLGSSANPAIVQNNVVFTATVPVTGVPPTGMVTFFDGTTKLGSAPLNSAGVATLDTAKLTGGVHTITASYSGDGTYTAVSSAPVAQKVSDYTIGNTTPTISVDPGGKADFNITVTPTANVGFAAPVVLTVTGLPASATSLFAAGTLTPGGNMGSTTMTVQTVKQVLTAMQHEQHTRTVETAVAWACLLPLLGMRRVRRRMPKALLLLLLSLASLGAVAPLTGCGGGYFGDTPQSYTLTVTGTSGQLQRSTTVTLTVR